jgi:hypothetical protein
MEEDSDLNTLLGSIRSYDSAPHSAGKITPIIYIEETTDSV